MSSSSWSARECADASIRWSMARNNVRRRWDVDDADVAHLTRRCRRVGARHVLQSETKSVCVREAPARRYAPRRSLTLQQCSTHLRHHWHARIIRVESQLTVQKSRRTAERHTQLTGHRHDAYNQSNCRIKNLSSGRILARSPCGEPANE